MSEFAFHENTCEKVRKAIKDCYRQQIRIRLFYGNTETGKTWNEEYDVVGTIGRSMGTEKIPLLINNKRSMGGGAILDHCIVRIITKTKKDGIITIYSHPCFHLPKMTIEAKKKGKLEYFDVRFDDYIQASFDNDVKAKNYVNFMSGLNMCK